MPFTEIAADSDSIATLFELVRETMVDVLGSSATATLLERTARRVAWRHPEVGRLTILRSGFDYVYQLPESWRRNDPSGSGSFRALCEELERALLEFTGEVVLRRFARLPALARGRLFGRVRGG